MKIPVAADLAVVSQASSPFCKKTKFDIFSKRPKTTE